MKLVSIALALLLTGCATARPALKADATAAERERAEACHVRAIAQAEAAVPYITPSTAPPQEWTWWKIVLSPVLLAAGIANGAPVAAVAVATSPVWVPIWLRDVRNRRQDIYQRAYAGCVADPAAETTFTVPEPDAHGMVRR